MSMDCRTVRELLDASREERQDWLSVELREAADHVDACDSCSEVLAQWNLFDRQLRSAMSQVAVPQDLKQRLLAACQAESATGNSSAASSSTKDSSSTVTTDNSNTPTDAPSRRQETGRNTRRWMLLASAASVLAVIGFWFWAQNSPTTMTLESVSLALADGLTSDSSRTVPRDVASLAPFDGHFDAHVHDLLWVDAVTPEARGLDLDGQPGHEAAVYQFRLQHGRIAGMLVVLPKGTLIDPPQIDTPSRTNVRYNPMQQVSWTRGEQVYVCVVTRGTIDDLLSQMNRLS
ncbi:MAG: hypothetical protein R3C01_16350 [Planctomycetaceae bacterium]